MNSSGVEGEGRYGRVGVGYGGYCPYWYCRGLWFVDWGLGGCCGGERGLCVVCGFVVVRGRAFVGWCGGGRSEWRVM